jgi:phage tail-like protein
MIRPWGQVHEMTMAGMPAGQSPANTGRGGLGSYPNFGLAMRFAVTVTGLNSPPGLPSIDGSLGLWQSCKGLQVELKYETFMQGGENLVDQWRPDKLVYSPVTLERAMEQNSSQTVQTWLRNYINNWADYQPDGTLPSGNVVIRLLDHRLNPVMTWTLVQARPSKWVGPTLSATETKPAIETLVIEHSGFLW